MSNDAIYQAFCTKVAAFAASQSPELTVAWPGIQFDPPQTGNWLEVSWFPGPSRNYGIADEGPTELIGMGQVSVLSRPGEGIDPALALVDALIADLPKGTQLDSVRVETQPWASTTVTGDDRLSVPVTIRYRGIVYS